MVDTLTTKVAALTEEKVGGSGICVVSLLLSYFWILSLDRRPVALYLVSSQVDGLGCVLPRCTVTPLLH